MRIFLFISMLLCSIGVFAADKVTEVFTLDHQMSQACEKKIKENLRFEKGIKNIEVSLKENTITVTYDSAKTDTDKIIDGFRKIGFKAFPVAQEVPCEVETPAPCCGETPAPQPAAQPAPAACCGGCGN